VTPPETERGFGTGLRSKLERQQNGGADELTLEEPPAAAPAPPVAVDVIVQATVPELDNVRGELQAALEREHILRDEAHAACRAAAEREAELEAWVSELQERELLLERKTEDLEREQHAVIERHTEIVAEYARVQELSGHAESRVEELETAERDRAEAAAQIAKQVAEVAERERELKRERSAFAARQQESEARVTARELAVRERDVSVGQKERELRDAETEAVGTRARLDARERSLQATEERLEQQGRELEEHRVATELALDERTRALAETEAALQTWEQRLRTEAERLLDERNEHGTTSQDAFALMAELESRELDLAKRETELHESQARLQAVSDDANGDDLISRRRMKEIDEREAALVAREAELNRQAAATARDERDKDLVTQLREELKSREEDIAAREQFFAERRERIESRDALLTRREREIAERAAESEKLEDELRVRYARTEGELDLREDKLEERLQEVEERERRLEQRERDMAGYVASVQERITAA
jgi:chromosome segregation ATPase